MTEPKRIQRQRTKGWRMPPDAIYVGRPSRWGNPVKIGDPFPRIAGFDVGGTIVNRMAAYNIGGALLSKRSSADPSFLAPLRGHDLACWCPLEDAKGNSVPCHAALLLELANRGDTG